jgi:hypothetical protein
MSVINYPSLYRDPAILVEHGEGVAHDRVMIWVGNAGGQTFTKVQWTELILSEAKRLGLKPEAIA